MINQFRALALEDIARELQRAKNTLILYHVRPDADAVGSAFALRELLRVMGVPVWCACSDELPTRLEFLADGTQGSVLLEDVGHLLNIPGSATSHKPNGQHQECKLFLHTIVLCLMLPT